MHIRFLLLILFLCSSVYAQDSTLKYSASISLAGASQQTPFWIYANQNGSIPTDGTFGIGQLAIYKVYNRNNPRMAQWSAGVEAVGSYGQSGVGFISDLYAAGKLGPVELLIGQKKQVTGIMDTTLTSGSLSMAGNSRPFPRIQLSIPEYYALGFTDNYVSIKASYSEGLLKGSDVLYGSVRNLDRTFFHQKTLYLRFGDHSHRIQIHAGINHQVVWGGQTKIFPLRKISELESYWHMVSGKALDYKIVGNHFGTIDLAATWNGNQWSYSIYRQSIFENGSIFKVINYTDALNGVSLKRIRTSASPSYSFNLNSFLFEFLNTKSQLNSSPPFGHNIFEHGNYYNHYLYRNGWSYLGSGIGTPLMPSQELTNEDLPTHNGQFTNNNRVLAYHVGASADWKRMTFLLKGTHSLNYGTYFTPFGSAKSQTSLLLSVTKQLKFLGNSSVAASFASDFGKLYTNSSGVMISLRKSGFLN